jgi:hypothetical protein
MKNRMDIVEDVGDVSRDTPEQTGNGIRQVSLRVDANSTVSRCSPGADNYHAVMKRNRKTCQNRSLLSAVLRCRLRKDGTDLADKLPVTTISGPWDRHSPMIIQADSAAVRSMPRRNA